MWIGNVKNDVMKLYVLGNGFDMAHGLNTSYYAFEEYVKEYHKEWHKLIGAMYRENDPSWLWKDYERNLSNVDIAGMTEEYNCRWLCMEKHEIENFFDNIYDRLQALFHEWVLSIDMRYCNNTMELSSRDYYINFNYTNVLETVYGIPRGQICYIHNDTRNQVALRPIVGHGDTFKQVETRVMNHKNDIRRIVEKEGCPKWCQDENDYVCFLMKCFQQLLGSLKKLPDDIIRYNQDYLDKLSRLPIDEVYVLGHSLSRVDNAYFKKLFEFEAIKNANWHVSYHSLKEWPILYVSFIRLSGYRKLPQMMKM